MSPEHTTILFERYSAIFARRHLSMSRRPMGYAIWCGDGWFDLIDRLCAELQWHVDRGDFEQVVAVQIKEKYAELRFYLITTLTKGKGKQLRGCARDR